LTLIHFFTYNYLISKILKVNHFIINVLQSLFTFKKYYTSCRNNAVMLVLIVQIISSILGHQSNSLDWLIDWSLFNVKWALITAIFMMRTSVQTLNLIDKVSNGIWANDGQKFRVSDMCILCGILHSRGTYCILLQRVVCLICST